MPTPSSAGTEEPLNADEGVGTTLSHSLLGFPKTLMHPPKTRGLFHGPGTITFAKRPRD